MTAEFTRRVDSASRLIRATPHAIYQAFIDPGALVRWLPPGSMKGTIDVFDPREGGEYRITLTYDRTDHPAQGKTTDHADVTRGRFLRLVPDRMVVQSVQFESDDPQFAGEMRITWLLEPRDDGTLVTVTAEDVPPGITPEDHQAGFTETLANLARFVEPVR
jgi:uncharacterized protein YndB with AHSA1/START domain